MNMSKTSKLKRPAPVRVQPVVRPIGRAICLDRCPPGLFKFRGRYGFKTEYSDPHLGPEAYCLESGEVFWGGVTDRFERGGLLVQPCEIEPNNKLSRG